MVFSLINFDTDVITLVNWEPMTDGVTRQFNVSQVQLKFGDRDIIFSVFHVYDECSDTTLNLPVQRGTTAPEIYVT